MQPFAQLRLSVGSKCRQIQIATPDSMRN
jgi:hypothetical protein